MWEKFATVHQDQCTSGQLLSTKGAIKFWALCWYWTTVEMQAIFPGGSHQKVPLGKVFFFTKSQRMRKREKMHQPIACLQGLVLVLFNYADADPYGLKGGCKEQNKGDKNTKEEKNMHGFKVNKQIKKGSWMHFVWMQFFSFSSASL